MNLMKSFDPVAECLSKIRRQICPRTSYSTSGTSATRLTILCDDENVRAPHVDNKSEELNALKESVIKAGEFESFYIRNASGFMVIRHRIGADTEHFKQNEPDDHDVLQDIPSDHVTLIALLGSNNDICANKMTNPIQQSDRGKNMDYDAALALGTSLLRMGRVPLAVLLVSAEMYPFATTYQSQLPKFIATQKTRCLKEGLGISVSKLFHASTTNSSNSNAGYRLVCIYCATQLGLSTPTTASARSAFGSNGQPSVHTQRQFQFLWEQAQEKARNKNSKGKGAFIQDSGWARLMQRLAEKEVFLPADETHSDLSIYSISGIHRKGKLSVQQWNRLLSSHLRKGCNDQDLYSLIRQVCIGSTLVDDLHIQLQGEEWDEGESSMLDITPREEEAKTDASVVNAAVNEEGGSLDPSSHAFYLASDQPTSSENTTSTTTTATTQEMKAHDSEDLVDDKELSEAGRAGFMLKMISTCIPSQMKGKIGSLLDYGCAEGAITAALGKFFDLPVSRTYGADVRSIPTQDFTFLHLPAELPETPPTPGTLLATLKSNSIHLITASMVFHHVTHPLAALLELRRVIRPNGCLVLREHHCDSAEMGAFLDITHGLFSLSWSVPVEWPKFLNEYQAWYRPQTHWDALARTAGFLRLEESEIAMHYEVRSRVKADGSIGNIIKAYYAVYVPAPGFQGPAMELPKTMTSQVGSTSIMSDAVGQCAEGNISAKLYGEGSMAVVPSLEPLAASKDENRLKRAREEEDITTENGVLSVMDANDVSGSSYVHITAQQDLPAKKKCIAEMQQQTDAEPSSSAAAIVFDSKWTQEGPAIDIFESRSNRGHFYFPTLAGKGPPKWVVLYYRLDPGQSAQMLVLREAHPVDPTTIYASEQDSGFRHRVRHIQYVRKDNPNC